MYEQVKLFENEYISNPELCVFSNCLNKSAGIRRFGVSGHKGSIRICEECCNRWETESPVLTYYVCGRLAFVNTITWDQNPKEKV